MIAPRLADGRCRVPFGHGLPEEIKEGLRKIARLENKSMSWVMEQVIVEFFHMKSPEYVPSAKKALVKQRFKIYAGGRSR
jgi:hypothetical protein